MNVQRHRTLWLLYLALFFFSLHVYFLLYIQSSFINQFVPESQLTFIYGTAALLAIFLLVVTPKILKKHVDSTLALIMITLNTIVSALLGYSKNPTVIVTAFILQQALIPIIFFSLDILIEHNSQYADTGHIRGRAFTAGNLAMVASPILAGYIGNHSSLQSVYPIALMFLLPLFWILMQVEKTDTELTTTHRSFFHVLQTFWSNKNHGVRSIFMVNMILHFFYTWMVIYSPIYLLHQGFNWDQIGVMFSIMLLPFLFLELPLGGIADTSFGHKKGLVFGTIVMAASVILFAYTKSENVLIWSAILFTTRVGASFIEVMAETYFFKHITARDVYSLALFRINRPLSQITAPLIASLSVWYVGESMSYVILAIVILYGLRYIIPLPDGARTTQ